MGSAPGELTCPQGIPTWLGPDSAPLFGVMHAPVDGVVRGGVVICAPLGREHLDTYRALKLLAQRLSAVGFAVLRFDYRGTGDSAGQQCLDTALQDYLDSIRTAVDYLHDAGVGQVAVVGLRVGALLAATAASALPGLAGMVLWDPVLDGRRFLREQRVLYKMTAGEGAPDSGVEPILGITFSATAAASVRDLKLPTTDSGVPTLLLVRPEHSGDQRLVELAGAERCSLREVAGQPDFVASPTIVVKIPVDTIAGIVTWLDCIMPRDARRCVPTIRRDSTVALLSDGRTIVETLEELGPHRLFAIRTTIDGGRDGGPTLLLHNTACEHRVGSGRIWPETARELAALGMTVVRYDRRGVGDTGFATAEYAWVHSDVARADALDALDALNARPQDVMMSGICSGAWNSAYAALSRGARSIIMINAMLYSLRRVDGAPERIGRLEPQPVDGEPTRNRRAVTAAKRLLKKRLPYQGWLLLGRLGYTQAPEVLLGALGRKGVPTELLLSPADYEWYQMHRGPIGNKRLARRGWSSTLVTAPTGDHAALQRDFQVIAREYLAAAVQREFGSALPGSAGDVQVIPDQSSTVS